MKRKKIKQKLESAMIKNEHLDATPNLGCMCNAEDVLPWWFPWFVVIVTMGVRICYVYEPESWWILHPDEVFQSAEVAFADVYGYGFYPYEYLPSPSNTSTPAEKQLAKMGMYSLRSFLYPKMFSVAMDIARWLYLPLTPFMVCRIFNVIVTSTLPLAVYHFVRRVLRCRLVSCLACALTASSVQLTIFGTHCIVNSFTAPFVFYGLTLCLPSHEDNKMTKQSTTDRKQFSIMNDDIPNKRNVLQKYIPKCAYVNRSTNGILAAPFSHSTTDTKKESQKSWSHPNKLSRFTCKTESYENYAKGTNSVKTNYEEDKKRYRQIIQRSFGGFIIGTICYIRPDTVLYVGAIYISVSITNLTLFQDLKFKIITNGMLLSITGAVIGILLGATYDCWRYEYLVIPPLNWIKFNLLTSRSSDLFGAKDHTEYTKFIFYSRYDEVLFVVALLFYSYKYLFGKTKTKIFRSSKPLQIAYVFLTICYFSLRHKEARFLHNFIVLYSILISYGVHILVETASQICVKKSAILTVTIFFLLSFSFNTFYNFPSATDALAKRLTYKNAVTSKDVNVCLDFVSRASNVRGLMIDASIFETHAFSLLQHDVPLLTKIHNEYRLYDVSNNGKFSGRRVRILSNYVDYVDAQNSQYLLRLLAISNTFNYIITSRKNNFKVIQFKEIFKSGKYSVLLRNLSVTEEKELNKMAETLPIGTNATVLEYETNWLLTSGLNELAVARGKLSLELDKSRVRVFQQLMVAYAMMEKWREVKKYQLLCYNIHGQSACEYQHEKVVLHNDYRQFDIS